MIPGLMRESKHNSYDHGILADIHWDFPYSIIMNKKKLKSPVLLAHSSTVVLNFFIGHTNPSTSS